MSLTTIDQSSTLDFQTFNAYRHHVLRRIEQYSIGQTPFFHLIIEDALPEELFEAIRARMFHLKYNSALQTRQQDSLKFVNSRFSLVDSDDPEIQYFRAIFSDPSVKHALLKKFYINPSVELEQSIEIHNEFEFMYTAAGRFQNIHIDIPAKFMSFVFYFPERDINPIEEERNATILYDKDLKPHYKAKYKSNSVCIFVPHFHSYHGFSSTIDREVLIMFYINEEEREKWMAAARTKDNPPFTALKEAIESKLRVFPLIEYGGDKHHLKREREQCLVNAPKGRVMREEDT